MIRRTVAASFLTMIGMMWFILCLFSALVPAAWANSVYPLATPRQEAQFTHLLKELRCLVCQNQDLADSNAPLAKDLRQQVYEMVKEGKSDSEIREYLTARFGDFILFKPPVKAITYLLWFGPLFFLILGFVIFWRSCFRKSGEAP